MVEARNLTRSDGSGQVLKRIGLQGERDTVVALLGGNSARVTAQDLLEEFDLVDIALKILAAASTPASRLRCAVPVGRLTLPQ